MIKLTTILNEIKVSKPGIPDLSDWNQGDIDGDPLVFDSPQYSGTVYAYRLSDTNEYQLEGSYKDGINIVKQIAEFFNVPISKNEKFPLIEITISTSQFKDLMKKAGVELDDNLDEIRVNTPQVSIIEPNIEDHIREHINKEIDKLTTREIKLYNKYVLDYILEQNAYVNNYSPVARFIKLHMIANHHEIMKNGQEILVGLSNAKLVNKEDIIDYINENINLKRYLEKITWRYYIDYVNEHRNEVVDKVINELIYYYESEGALNNMNFVDHILTKSGAPDEIIQHQFDDSVLTFPEEAFSEPEFEEYLRQILEKSEMLGENTMIKLLPLLKEYSDKTINDTITRWGIDPEDKRAVADAKAVIQRFDQIKSALSQRLDIAVIPDEIRSRDYKNIDLYSYEDMLNLLRSLPESDEKIKKEAIRRFVEESGLNKDLIQSTVARFIAKKAELKLAVKDGLEEAGYSAEDIQGFIPKRLLRDDKYLDPRYWKWDEFERMMDTLFPSQAKMPTEEGENTVETDADKVYDSGGLEIYRADDYHKCIKYNPTLDSGGKKYSWCVTLPGGQEAYRGYRFRQTSPTFYFVIDRNIPSTPDKAPFDNRWHTFVIQVYADGERYMVTSANNGDDTEVESWDAVGTKSIGTKYENGKTVGKGSMDPEVWSRLKGLKSYFKPVSLNPVERAQKLASGRNLTVGEFKELPQDEKITYVIGKGSQNQLTRDILSILPKYKIPYQGKTTTLANIAIDAGQRFTYNDLKEIEQLAKRYAVFRFRHTNYGKEPIPLPFVQYLDDASKYKYYETFDDNLTFDLIDRYFGNKIAKEYIDEQISKLSYLPSTAAKYMSPEQKTLYDLYSKLYTNWEERVSDEDTIETSNIMPTQEVDPKYITVDEWQNLSTSDKRAIINLAKKYNGDEDYKVLLYALPYMIENNGKTYILLPVDGFKTWIMLDETGRVVEDNIEGRTSFMKNTRLSNGYPTDGSLYRVYSADDVKINGNPLSLKENVVKRMQQLAGITEIKVNNPGNPLFYVYDTEGIEGPLGPFDLEQANHVKAGQGANWDIMDKKTATEVFDLDDEGNRIEEIKVINPATEQILIDFIDRNYKEFSRLGNSEVEEYDINDFEDLADDIFNYLKSRPDNRFDYRGICVYWSDLYNTLSIENMNAEEDDDDERNEYYPDPDNI